MDKYEFKVKVEQLKKMVDRGDYETAMKIADGIDWRRVRSTSLLSLVSTVYERNDELQDAKDILLLAFERAPKGKRILFKLTELALRSNDVKEAEVYYTEFCDICDTDPDPRQDLLRFLILEAKGASLDQQITSLERYCRADLDEKWMYRLAEVYEKAGRTDDCVRVCDKIMLMFGIGKYVDQAMQLKLKYAPLNERQIDLFENREKYEENLRAVEEMYRDPSEMYTEEEPVEEEPAAPEFLNESEAEPVPEEEAIPEEKTAEPEPEMTIEEDSEPVMPVVTEASDVEIEASIKEAEASDELAREMSKIAAFANEEDEEAETRVFKKIKVETPAAEEAPEEEAPAEETSEEAKAEEVQESAPTEAEVPAEDDAEMPVIEELDPDEDEEDEVPVKTSYHLMIEAVKPENGLALALQSLKEIHKEIGSVNSVAKISGEKLSKKGIFALASKIEGKDLVIERAADLDAITIDELNELMERDETGILVVLIDTPARLEKLHRENPELAGRFQYIGCDKPEAGEVSEEELERERQETEEARRRLAEREEEIRRKAARDAEEAAARREAALKAREEAELKAKEEARLAELAAREEEEEAARAEEAAREEARRAAEEEEARRRQEYEADRTEASGAEDDEVMDVEEFAQYASKYAEAIDCSISGKSMLALYGRAEMMEEDGIPLTKQAAEDLIEEAADKAEKKSFGGIFSSKYNKEGLLILKEKHFYD